MFSSRSGGVFSRCAAIYFARSAEKKLSLFSIFRNGAEQNGGLPPCPSTKKSARAARLHDSAGPRGRPDDNLLITPHKQAQNTTNHRRVTQHRRRAFSSFDVQPRARRAATSTACSHEHGVQPRASPAPRRRLCAAAAFSALRAVVSAAADRSLWRSGKQTNKSTAPLVALLLGEAVRVGRLPRPEVAAHLVEAELRRPAELARGLGRVGVHDREVARSPVDHLCAWRSVCVRSVIPCVGLMRRAHVRVLCAPHPPR